MVTPMTHTDEHGKGHPRSKKKQENLLLSREERSSDNEYFSKDQQSSSVSRNWWGRGLRPPSL